MPAHLLDVNVLVALVWPNHVHHARVHKWFAGHAGEGWASCPMTQCGFVRISSNPRVIVEAVSPVQAIDVLEQLCTHPNHVFWADDLSVTAIGALPATLAGHQQVTDAYLAALARHHGGRLATLDHAAATLSDVVQLIPA